MTMMYKQGITVSLKTSVNLQTQWHRFL